VQVHFDVQTEPVLAETQEMVQTVMLKPPRLLQTPPTVQQTPPTVQQAPSLTQTSVTTHEPILMPTPTVIQEPGLSAFPSNTKARAENQTTWYKQFARYSTQIF
jgi:hypothetical protein